MKLTDLRTRHSRLLCGLAAVVCLSSAFWTMAGGNHPMLGFAGEAVRAFDWYCGERSDSGVFVLRAIEIPLVLALMAAHVAGLLTVLALMCVLLVPYLVVLMFVKIAMLSIVGAIVVFIIAGSITARYVRKYWTDIAEAIAWVTLFLESMWRSMEPAQKVTVLPAGAALSIATTGEVKMSDRYKPIRINPTKNDAAVEKGFAVPAPDTLLGSFRRRIRSDATAEAFKSETKMVNSAIDLGRAHLAGYELETDWENKALNREEKTIQQEISVIKAEDERAELLAKRAERSDIPRNRTDRLFEVEYKPTVANAQKAKVHEARSRAEALIEASRIAFELEQRIDNGPGTPEQKADLKRAVRAELDIDIGRENSKRKAASASPYEDDHQSHSERH